MSYQAKLIKHPRFSYLNSDQKVYLIQKIHPYYPFCNRRCEYLSAPIQLKHNNTLESSLVGFVKKCDATKELKLVNVANAELLHVSCKDAIYLSELLSLSLAILISRDSYTSNVFFKPKRHLK